MSFLISISDNLLKQLYSNVIPKADVKISIKKGKYDGTGEYVEEDIVVFRGKDITNVKYNSSIDVIGSELPCRKLTWEQVFTGDVGEDMSPILDQTYEEGMAVYFSLVYDYRTYFSWKNIFTNLETWKSLYESGKTWRDVLYSKKQEEVVVCKLFLSGKPTLQNNKLVFEANDVLSFLNHTVDASSNFLRRSYAFSNRKELLGQIIS